MYKKLFSVIFTFNFIILLSACSDSVSPDKNTSASKDLINDQNSQNPITEVSPDTCTNRHGFDVPQDYKIIACVDYLGIQNFSLPNGSLEHMLFVRDKDGIEYSFDHPSSSEGWANVARVDFTNLGSLNTKTVNSVVQSSANSQELLTGIYFEKLPLIDTTFYYSNNNSNYIYSFDRTQSAGPSMIMLFEKVQ